MFCLQAYAIALTRARLQWVIPRCLLISQTIMRSKLSSRASISSTILPRPPIPIIIILGFIAITLKAVIVFLLITLLRLGEMISPFLEPIEADGKSHTAAYAEGG